MTINKHVSEVKVMDIYRYISFESFVDILQSKALTFVNPLTSWEDGYEGIVFRALQTNDGQERIQEILDSVSSQHFIIAEMAKFIRCQCWTKTRDSIAMWSTYRNNDKAEMIKSRSDKIECLTNGNTNIRLHEVDYYELNDESNLEEELKRVIGNAITGEELDISRFFVSKRIGFQHENEVRAITSITPGEDFLQRIDKPLRVEITQPISDFIEEVMVHPKAEDWYTQVIKDFCAIYGVNFSGKSDILQFNISSLLKSD